MDTPITKLCLIRGFTEAYHQLTETERTELWDEVNAGIEKVGAKMAGPYYNCRWSNDKYATFFLMEYPNTEAAIGDTAACEEANLFRYMISETILGIPQEAV
jgi:hypothetical protein